MTDTSFDSLVRPEVERLYRLAYRLTDSRPDAEDLVQDALIKAYERRAELAGTEYLGAWLARVLYNRFIDNRRQYERQRLRIVQDPGDPDVHPSDTPSPEQAADAELDITKLKAALAELSLEQRGVLLMHDAEGYKLEEIHRITGVEIGTLKSRLHRARRRLRDVLGRNGTI